MKYPENSKFLLFLILIFSFSCCNNENKILDKRNGLDYPNFEERNSGLGNVLQMQDTLKIIVKFTECGEWGGHVESIFLTRDSENNILARLMVDSVSCDNHNGSMADRKSVIILDTTKQLIKQEEKLLNLFLHRVFELYLNKENLYEESDSMVYIYAGSGSSINIENTNTTLNLRFWNVDELSNTWYTKIKNQIFKTKVVEIR